MKIGFKRILVVLTSGLMGLFFYYDGPSVIKSIWLIKSGGVVQDDFLTTIPFEYDNGEIVIHPILGGKQYSFVLDTGSPTLISEAIANELGLLKVVSDQVEDSGKIEKTMQFVKIPEINIGQLAFTAIGSGVVLEKEIRVFNRCGRRDGIIGANLMRYAVWEVNYRERTIRIADSMEKLRVSQDAKEVPFSTDLVGRPFIELHLNALKDTDVLIDLGMESGLKVSNDALLDRLRNTNQVIAGTQAYGFAGVGLFGVADPDVEHFVLIDSLSLGPEVIENPVIRFVDDDKDSKIGNGLLEDYTLILDWNNNTLALEHGQLPTAIDHYGYGFKPLYANSRLSVGYLIQGSIAQETGLRMGDTIISVDTLDTRNLSDTQWCRVRSSLKRMVVGDTLHLAVRRNGTRKDLRMVPKPLFWNQGK